MPADGGPPPAAVPGDEDTDDDAPQSLLQILSEHLSLAFLARARADIPDREAREWDRLCVGYLCLLVQWLWEDPPAVREFLEAGALGVVSAIHSLIDGIVLIICPIACGTDQPDRGGGCDDPRSLRFFARGLLRVQQGTRGSDSVRSPV